MSALHAVQRALLEILLKRQRDGTLTPEMANVLLGQDVQTTFPGGIDYAKWEKGVTAAPREAFADTLDDLTEEPMDYTPIAPGCLAGPDFPDEVESE